MSHDAPRLRQNEASMRNQYCLGSDPRCQLGLSASQPSPGAFCPQPAPVAVDQGADVFAVVAIARVREAAAALCLTAIGLGLGIKHGLAFETVLPGSDISSWASANNILFTLVPQGLGGWS